MVKAASSRGQARFFQRFLVHHVATVLARPRGDVAKLDELGEPVVIEVIRGLVAGLEPTVGHSG